MTKKIPNTLQQRLGFMDPDLVRPDHDQIMLWLDRQVVGMLPQWVGIQQKLDPQQLDRFRQEAEKAKTRCVEELKRDIEVATAHQQRNSNVDSAILAHHINETRKRENELTQKLDILTSLAITPAETCPAPRVDRPVWEYPVQDSAYKGKAYVVGFADMMVRYWTPTLELNLGDLAPNMFMTWKHNAVSTELYAPTYVHWKEYKAFFEVKTEIPSLGELLRQINLYKTYLSGEWFVVSPDVRFRDTLAEQGVGFIEYKPDTGQQVE